MTKIGDKAEHFLAQKRKVFQAFFNAPKTMLQASIETTVMRSNICYYVRDFRKSNSICVVKNETDPLTGFRADYLSTNPKECNSCQQTKLFE